MKRSDLEHVVGAAAQIAGEVDFVVVGSQAILGSHPDAPAELLRSMEADLYPMKSPEKATDLDGQLGDGSRFHQSFGYFAHGVGPETAVAPAGWEERLVEVPIDARPGSSAPATAWCLEPNDLVLAKAVRGFDRDWEFARVSVDAGIVDLDHLLSLIDKLPIQERARDHIRQMLSAMRRP